MLNGNKFLFGTPSNILGNVKMNPTKEDGGILGISGRESLLGPSFWDVFVCLCFCLKMFDSKKVESCWSYKDS